MNVRRVLQHGAAKWVDPLFRHRHPGAFGRSIVRMLAPMVRTLQPNDQWNLEAFADDWLNVLDAAPLAPLPASKRIFMFTGYRTQFTHDIVLALFLAWRGHKITMGYFPKLQSPIKEPLEDDPSAVPYVRDILAKISKRSRGRVECIDLSQWPADANAIDREFVDQQLYADLVMNLQRETFSEDEPQVRRLLAYYWELGTRTQAIGLGYLSANKDKFDLALIANGSTYESAQIAHAAEQVGLPLNCYEKFAFRNVRIINHGGEFPRFDDLDLIWKRREELGFNAEPFRSRAIEAAWQLLRERRDSSGKNWGWKLQGNKKPLERSELWQMLGAEPSERIALVCPNIPFDAGYRGLLGCFPAMREWLIATVRQLIARSEVRTVVRAHPGEDSHYCNERIADVLSGAGIDLNQLILIPGKHPLNTYALMDVCDFGVVFSSTTGVEMAMHGKPVLPGAGIYYTRRGFTVDAASKDEYAQKLAELVAGMHRPAKTAADDAAMLYFIFHFLLQWTYPYDKPSQISALRPADLVASKAMAKYVETLDAMTLSPGEWEGGLSSYLSSQAVSRRLGWSL